MTSPNDPSLREIADRVAMDDSKHTSALRPHRIMTGHLWMALRTLGFDSGRVLVHGDDPTAFLGHPQAKGHGFASLTATVGPADHRGYPVQAERFTDVTERFDLVIGALPYNDVKFTHPAHQTQRNAWQDLLTLTSLNLTRPGGLTVILASHDLLDAPHTKVRQQVADQAELIGAVRLPGGIQRNIAGTDNPTDFLLLHRAAPGAARHKLDFTYAAPISINGRMLLLNNYFDERPDYVLGQIGVDPFNGGPNALTVTADPTAFEADLSDALEDIATQSRRSGLMYESRATRVDVATQDAEQRAVGGASLNVAPAREWEPGSGDDSPDWDDPSLGEPGLGLW